MANDDNSSEVKQTVAKEDNTDAIQTKENNHTVPNIRGTVTPITISGYKCSVYLPKQYTEQNKITNIERNDSSNLKDTEHHSVQLQHFPVAYLLGESDIAPVMQIVEKQFCPPFILIGIEAVAWESDFSPWPAAPLVKKSNPFTGGAPAFLTLLQNEIKPYVDAHYSTLPAPENTTLAGYSLAGLTTLFALYTTNFARNFASMSGSLWYEGWVDFCNARKLSLCEDATSSFASDATSNETKQTPPVATKNVSDKTATPLHLYLSLGNTEKNSRHPLMCKVDDCTQATLSLLKQQLQIASDNSSNDTSVTNNELHPSNTLFFEYNDGGHFNDIPTRIAKGLVSLHKRYLYPADYITVTATSTAKLSGETT